MRRDIACYMELGLSGAPMNLVFAIAAASNLATTETLALTVDGQPVELRELTDRHGARLHQFSTSGTLATIEYRASIEGSAPLADSGEDDAVDRFTYLRPSRYCESDTLGPTAAAEFGGLSGRELVSAVEAWTHARLTYVAGASQPTDGAVATVLSRQGVCRDYAHVVIALLRAMDTPARLVSCYAPGLSPMEFHAVAEAWVDGAWHVLDATRKAPRSAMVRIATGRDAADTAFLSNYHSRLELNDYRVTAVVSGDLPGEDPHELVVLA